MVSARLEPEYSMETPGLAPVCVLIDLEMVVETGHPLGELHEWNPVVYMPPEALTTRE